MAATQAGLDVLPYSAPPAKPPIACTLHRVCRCCAYQVRKPPYASRLYTKPRLSVSHSPWHTGRVCIELVASITARRTGEELGLIDVDRTHNTARQTATHLTTQLLICAFLALAAFHSVACICLPSTCKRTLSVPQLSFGGELSGQRSVVTSAARSLRPGQAGHSAVVQALVAYSPGQRTCRAGYFAVV